MLQKVLIAGAVSALAACSGRNNVQCEESSNCNLSGGGICLAAPTGNMWCAYPDPACLGGYRYSELDVGDGLSGECVVDGANDAGIDTNTFDAPGTWSAPAVVANVNTTADEHYPAISSDGLELYLARLSLNPPYGEIFVARRTSTTQPFGSASPLTEVNGSNSNEIFAVPAHSGLELFVSVAGIVMRFTRATQSSQWTSGTSTGITANFISLSPDDLTMCVVARCPSDVSGGFGPCFYTSTRSAVGTAFSTPAYVAWDGSTQWQSASVAPSGLRLLVSGNFSGSGVSMAVQQRASNTDPWSGTEVISALALETTNQEGQWNATASEVYLSARPATNASNGYDIYVSVLK